MAERRKYPRIRAKFPCELRFGGHSVKARVRDLSEGGLSVLADIEEPDQGESVAVTLHPPNRLSIELACVFWHSRSVRVVGEDRSTVHLGLVLSAPSDDFFELVDALRDRKPAPPQDATEPVAKLSSESSEASGSIATTGDPVLHQYSVRVKQNGGPRSTRLVVAARDLRDAEDRALAEIGLGWMALEVRRANPTD